MKKAMLLRLHENILRNEVYLEVRRNDEG